MFAIRLYLAVLVLVFLLVAALRIGITFLVGTVVVCSLLYLILDMSEELRSLRKLEAYIAILERQ